MKNIFIVAIVLFISQFSKVFAKLPPPGTGTSGIPANILIMLDNSGSMSWDINGNYISSWRTLINYPNDVAVDTSGNVYAIEGSSRRIRVFDKTGAYVKQIGGGYGFGCNQFVYPFQIDIDNNNKPP